MQCQIWKRGLSLGCVALLTLTVACGDDSKDDAAEGTGTESGDAPETGTEGVEGDGDGDPGDGDGDTGDGDGDPGDGDPGDGDGDTGDGDGDPIDSECFELEEQSACDANADCQSVVGQPLKEGGGDAPCLEPSEFLGCIPMTGCGEAETWFCVGGNNKPFLVPNTCGPEDGEPCDAPAGEPFEACP